MLNLFCLLLRRLGLLLRLGPDKVPGGDRCVFLAELLLLFQYLGLLFLGDEIGLPHPRSETL